MRLTSLYRSVAPWRPSLVWVWFATSVTFFSTWHAHGLHSGIRGAGAVFLAWAITRELAPGRRVAAAAAPFAAICFAIPADTDLLACAGVLLVARIATRSVGDAPTRLDLLVLVGLAAWLATRLAGLPVAIVLAGILASDTPPRRARIAGIAALVVAVVVGSVEGTMTARPGFDDHTVAAEVLLAFAGAAAAWLAIRPLPARLRARDDRRRGQLRGTRVRSARIAVAACVLAAIGWTGTDGAFALSAASAALLAAGCFGASARPAHGTDAATPGVAA